MPEKEKLIPREAIETLIEELEAFVEDSVFDADQKANDQSASQFFRSDMQGYSRGLSHMGYKIITKVKNLLST